MVIISYGMHIGWTPIFPILHSPGTPVAISESDEDWLETIIMIGAFCAIPITIYLVDKIGRKLSILISVILNLISWILIALANSVEYLYVSRFIAGTSGSLATVTVPMYVAEIAEDKIRGFLTGIINIIMQTGLLIIYAIGPFVKMQFSALVPIVLLTFTFFALCQIPESPCFFLLKNKPGLAAKSLLKFRGNRDISNELCAMSAAVRQQKAARGSFLDLITVRSNFKSMIIIMILNLGQNFAGIVVIHMNLHTILETVPDAPIKLEYAAVIYSSILTIGSTVSILLVDKLGRKILLSTSSILTGIALSVVASYFTTMHAGVDVSSIGWLPIAALIVYALVVKVGLTTVPVILTSELFPTNIKAIGMSISDGMSVLFAIFATNIYFVLSKNYGIEVAFFVFSAICIVIGIVCIAVVPETKGKTLEQIQEQL